jgi:hypothetical protein
MSPFEHCGFDNYEQEAVLYQEGRYVTDTEGPSATTEPTATLLPEMIDAVSLYHRSSIN